MKKLFCITCQQEVDVTTELKSNNYVAHCSACGRYIKNVSHREMGIVSEIDYVFPFGKYVGESIKNCRDREYMIWYRSILKSASPGMLNAITQRIQSL